MSQISEIAEEIRGRIGEESGRRVSFPVDKSAIRLWAIGTRWPDPPKRLYWDEEYARKTKWGGIIAPRGFNPFAYHVDEERMQGRSNRGIWKAGTGNQTMNGGGITQYFEPIKPGDIITEVHKIVSVTEKPTRLGPTIFVTTENRWANQHGKLVKIYRGIGIRY